MGFGSRRTGVAVIKKILVVDDVQSLRKTIAKVLTQEGFSVVCAADGSDGLLLAQEARPDLILCDAVMPGLGGHALLRVLKQKKGTAHIPVIIMSGELIEEADVVSGLEGGADDYLPKPFSMRVLLARIRAVLRRFEGAGEGAAERPRSCRGLELDPASREVAVGGKSVALTRKEFDLLALFLASPRRVLKTDYLLETIWGYDLADYNDPHTVQAHVSRLRRKLGPKLARRILNVHGLGYKFEAE